MKDIVRQQILHRFFQDYFSAFAFEFVFERESTPRTVRYADRETAHVFPAERPSRRGRPWSEYPRPGSNSCRRTASARCRSSRREALTQFSNAAINVGVGCGENVSREKFVVLIDGERTEPGMMPFDGVKIRRSNEALRLVIERKIIRRNRQSIHDRLDQAGADECRDRVVFCRHACGRSTSDSPRITRRRRHRRVQR